jgi:flagellar biosynthesis protein FlhF
MLLELAKRQRATPEVPADVLAPYVDLLAADVDEPLARNLVTRLHERCTPAEIADPPTLRLEMTRLIESELRCREPVGGGRGVRKVIALVGPTGVGKTTTLAKLAANFRFRDGLRTGLVTFDTYRIAAVEQLRTYARIVELPMRVVATPAEMRSALDELAGLDVVLIDTAGRSPRAEAQIAELNEQIAAASPDETHLVLSLAAGRSALSQALARFRAVAPTAVIFTKLDEAGAAGPILSLCRDGGLPLSYVTIGQNVPDDIEPARADNVAQWIVNGLKPGTHNPAEDRPAL